MAGHSKWANIRHRKGAQDAKRGKIFTKLIREITVAAKQGGGGDPASNPRLRAAIDKALGANMTKDKIEKAIKKATGEDSAENFEEVTYEGYGPNGVAVLVECLTDNRNRTVSEVRHAFSKNGGNLGTDGSVAFIFSKVGILSYGKGNDEDTIMEAALEAGAEDVVTNDDGSIEVVTSFEDYFKVKNDMIENGMEPENAEITMQASNNVDLEKEDAETIIRMVEMLEDLDDVQNVYSNAAISDEILEGIG
jgi:YebC/PmpR family DNA-binding regulatory protein